MTISFSRHTVRLSALALGVLLTLGVGTSAWAQWKWKDKTGRVQYSDLPPPSSVGEQDILQRPAGSQRAAPSSASASQAPATAAPIASGPANGAEPELEAKRRKAEQEEAAKRKAEEDKVKTAKADNCQRAKAQLRTLDEGMRMARVNEKGEREILDDKARADESQRARDIVNSDCK